MPGRKHHAEAGISFRAKCTKVYLWNTWNSWRGQNITDSCRDRPSPHNKVWPQLPPKAGAASLRGQNEPHSQICRDDAGKASARPAHGRDRPALRNYGTRRGISRHDAPSHQTDRCRGPSACQVERVPRGALGLMRRGQGSHERGHQLRPGPSHKHDNEPHSDQGVQACNGYAEINIGHDALRLELDLLAAHCTFPMLLSQPQ